MNLPLTNYSIHPSNYNKSTPKWLKWLADILLLISCITELAIPEFEGKQWIVAGGGAFKLISKFITDHTIPVEVQS